MDFEVIMKFEVDDATSRFADMKYMMVVPLDETIKPRKKLMKCMRFVMMKMGTISHCIRLMMMKNGIWWRRRSIRCWKSLTKKLDMFVAMKIIHV